MHPRARSGASVPSSTEATEVPRDESDADPLVGRVLDGAYRIERLLGGGGMGRVYLADQILLGRKVAVKVMRDELRSDAQLVERFLAEARAGAKLNHPNCAAVLGVGRLDGGAPYLALELLRGRSMRALLDEGPLDVPRILVVARGILAALAEAHACGIVHRDVKPDNIALEPRGRTEVAKLLDFGLALGAQDRRLTPPTSLVGTPEYMAPEQFSGLVANAAVDVYALGASLYEAITGRLPHVARTVADLAVAKCTIPIDPRVLSRRTDVPEELARAVVKALAPLARNRYASAAEMLDDLADIDDDGEIAPRSSSAPVATSAPTGFDIPTVWAAVGEAHDGVRTVAVVGPAGSGRTTVLGQIAGEARAQGALVVELAHDPSRVPIAYAPVRRAVSALYGGAMAWRPKVVRDLALGEAEAVGWRELGGLEPPVGTSRAIAIGIAFRAALVEAAARRGAASVLVVADDLDSLDQPTIDVVRALVDAPRDARVSLAFAASHVPDALATVPRSTLETHRGDDALPLATQLARHARHAMPRGMELSVVVDALVESLDRSARLALQALAVCGVDVTTSLLDAVEPGGSSALGRLASSGLVSTEGDRAFLHPAVRDLVLGSIPFAQRRALHDRALLANEGAPLAVRAYHAWAGSDPVTALILLEKTAQEARALGDTSGAKLAYRRKLDLARAEMHRDGDENYDSSIVAAALGLGEVLLAEGDTLGAEGVLAEALVFAAPWHAKRGRLLLAVAQSWIARGKVQLALDAIDEIQRARELDPVVALVAAAIRASAANALERDDLARAPIARLAEAAKVVSLPPALVPVTARALATLGPADAVPLLDAFLRRAADDLARAHVLAALAEAQRRAGHLEKAEAALRRAADHARSAGDIALVRELTASADAVAQSLARPESARDPSSGVRSRPLAGVRVLVVDDNEDARIMSRVILGESGASVRTAGSMQACLAQLDREPPHVVLSDLAMPGKDGYALLEAIRARPDAAKIPVVAVTALALPEDRERALSAGFAVHVPKPIDPKRLVEAVRAVLAKPPAPRRTLA